MAEDSTKCGIAANIEETTGDDLRYPEMSWVRQENWQWKVTNSDAALLRCLGLLIYTARNKY